VRRAARQLADERDDWARPLALIAEGELAAIRDDAPRALALYRQAAQSFAASSMELHHAFAARRAAALAGDAPWIAAIDRQLADRGIRRVDRLRQVYTPSREAR
jgi:hypothetical protein